MDSLPRAERDRLCKLEIENCKIAVSKKYQGPNTVSTGFENFPDAGYRQRNELTHRIDFIVRKYQTQEERRIDDMNRRIELQFALRS